MCVFGLGLMNAAGKNSGGQPGHRVPRPEGTSGGGRLPCCESSCSPRPPSGLGLGPASLVLSVPVVVVAVVVVILVVFIFPVHVVRLGAADHRFSSEHFDRALDRVARFLLA